MPFHGSPDLTWGYRVTYDENGDETGPRAGLVLAPTALPALSFDPTNVFATPGGLLALPVPYFSTVPKLYAAGTWKDAPLYTHATDMAADGTAIADRFGAAHLGLAAPILLNGKWSAIERGPLTTGIMETAVLLPIRVEGQFTNQHGVIVKKAAGVDDKSITSSEPGSTVLDRIWVMVPKGGLANSVTVKAPVSETAPLKLSAEGVGFGGTSDITTLTQRETLLSIIAGSAVTGTDIPVSLKFGELESLSKPLGLKVMKSRNVALTVHLVTSRTANPDPTKPDKLDPPDFQSTKTAVKKHLNDIYGPQVNARFTVTINGPVILNWDNTNAADLGITDPDYNPIISPGNKRLDFMGGHTGPEENLIDAALRDDAAELNVYILGGAQLTAYITLPGGNQTTIAGLAYGVARRLRNLAFVDGDAGLYAAMLPGRDANAELMHTIAHEIGHCIIADGHPDEGGGAAPLKGVPMSLHKERLMVSGSKVNHSDFGKLLVKGEWDEAEKWLSDNVDNQGN